jgi:hypothetical protein
MRRVKRSNDTSLALTLIPRDEKADQDGKEAGRSATHLFFLTH